MKNHRDGLATLRTTGDPFFDDDEEVRENSLLLWPKQRGWPPTSEIEALVAEHGPEARQVLG